ncbi:MAG: LD-carboxypeptidase [Candidatus Saccharimonadales bacterium]
MKSFVDLAPLMSGDQVAILSPSNGLPQIFPDVYELGLQRIRDLFGLVPKEYSTTRIMGAPLKDRARDVMAAFADNANKAVITSIGGEDQIKLIKYLDADVIKANPKPFLGYSDNTHIHNFLWNLGIPSFYGGAIMTQFAMHGQMHDMTVQSIRQALFDKGEVEIRSATDYNDVGLDWQDSSKLSQLRMFEPNEGFFWDGNSTTEGILWGGCVESLIYQSTVDKYLPKIDELTGTILFIETAEDIPEAWLVEYLLSGFGERGWFDQFQGVLVGRPKAWEFDKQKTADEKAAYRSEQRETVLRTVRQYNKSIPVVQNIDFGHTDPQILLPMGNRARIDAQNQQIYLTY